MPACYKAKGQTLCDRLDALYSEYGYYYDAQASYKLQGIAGKEKIKTIMATLRAASSEQTEQTERAEQTGAAATSGSRRAADATAFWRTGQENGVQVLDYAKGIAGLPTTDLLKYKLADGFWIAIRPSGTEPKLKLYCSLVEKDETAAKARFEQICRQFEAAFGL